MVNLTNIDKKKFEAVSNFWGDFMPMKTMEESGELIQAISKYEVLTVSAHQEMSPVPIEEKYEILRTNLMEEIRDVYISLEALKFLYDIDDNEINRLIEEKLNMRK